MPSAEAIGSIEVALHIRVDRIFQRRKAAVIAGVLQPELHALSKQGRWQEMGGLIDDLLLLARVRTLVGPKTVIGATR